MKRIKKQGVFFTIASLLFAILLITLSSLIVSYKLADEMTVIRARVISLENFMQSLEEDLERASFIAGFRGLVALNNHITSNGTYLSDASAQFERIIVNGSIQGNTGMEALMENQTLLNWSDKVQAIASEIGISTSVDFIGASVSHVDPWNIQVEATFNISIEDNRKTATLKRELTTKALLPVETFEDPTYRIETLGQISRKIVKTNTTKWNASAVLDHLEKGTYVAYNGSSSYLMKLEGDFSSSEFGIETLVDKNELAQFSLPVQNRSNADYLYWGNVQTNLARIDGISNNGYANFVLDDEHITFFNLTGDTY